MHRPQFVATSLLPAAAGLLGLLFGCTAEVTPPSSQTTGGMSSTGGSGMVDPPISTACASELPASKRIVRLSFNQIANSIGSLLDRALGTKIVTDFELLDVDHRAFPPLQSPREGNSLTDQSWNSVNRIAEAAGKHVFDNFATATACGAAPTDECAQQYVNTLAAKVYRRPLTPAEQTRLTGLYTSLKTGVGATINEAVQHSVYALFATPQFLYRTEFGSDWRVDGALTSYELASMLSYFLTDDAPDQPLLDAAAQNKLSTAAEIGAHVDRFLASDAAKVNLHGALVSYFSYPNLETVVIQDDAFTGEMRKAMYQESKLFLQNTLWSAPLNELLTSRKGYVNATLAPIYGVTFPPAGVTPDATGFAQIELPANRTGLLAQPGFLANRSRPNETSVVGRGLLVKGALLCTETPAPTAAIQDKIEMIGQANPNASERELADIRAATSPCNTCHASFDAYGLALDSYDVLGRYRMVDPEGRPIDPSVTLPLEAGGGTAANIVEVATQLAATGAFTKCMGMNLVNYALADVSAGAADIASCAADEVAKTFAANPDQSFSGLVKAVAVSAAFSSRSKGSEGVAQ
jgi:hypothetical protein